MRFLLVFLFTIISLPGLYAQNQFDSISVKPGTKSVFMQNGDVLTLNDLMTITASNVDARHELNAAKDNGLVGTIFGLIGGGLVGFPIGTAIGGGKANWNLAWIGAGFAVVSIPFTSASVKRTKNAVRIYNRGLKPTVMPGPDLNLGFTGNGLVLKLQF